MLICNCSSIGTWILTLIGKQLQTNCQNIFSVLNVSIRIHHVSQWGHGGHAPWGSGSNSLIVTWLNQSAGHVPEQGTRPAAVEGHVPKGVEVQVLSSAHQTERSLFDKGAMYRKITPSGTWFFLCSD
jgi:hypothetical protein